MHPFTHTMPTEIVFGAGCLRELARFSPRFQRPVILCGRRSARDNGALDAVRSHFPDASVLDQFPENPETAVCEAYARKCRVARADAVIGVGGGSVLDGAKAIAMLAPNKDDCSAYFDTPPAQPPLPVLAIPTTAGTGSEVTPYAVLVDAPVRKKRTLKHPGLFPVAAFLDPDLTRSLPPAVTLATGLDALSQGMEGYVSRRATPLGDLLALEVCRRVYSALPRVCANRSDDEARASLLYAAMLSGIVIAQSGTTLVHGMGYYYTLEHGTAHGIANALLLPPVFQWNARHLPEKVALLADALGMPAAPEPEAAGDAILRALHAFYAMLGLPPAARDHGIPEAAIARFAADIARDPYRFKNQVGADTVAQVEILYQASWTGESVPKWR